MGKPSHDKTRDVVAKFARFGGRDAVFKKEVNFKNAPVFLFVPVPSKHEKTRWSS